MSSLRTASAASIAALLLALAGSATATPITTWTHNLSQLQYGYYDNEAIPQVADYDNITPNITASPLDNGIKLSTPGDGAPTFSITGTEYIPTALQPVTGEATAIRGNRFTNYGGGTIDGTAWQHPDDIVRTTFNFGFNLTGGELALYEVRTFFILSDSEGGFVTGVGSSTGFEDAFLPGGHGLGFAFEDRFGSNIATAVSIFWGVELYFDWTNQGDKDTLAFYVGNDSIDIQAQTVPTPGAAALLTLAGLTTARRRRN
jgi:MYXO-CTERM domain-containing protein